MDCTHGQGCRMNRFEIDVTTIAHRQKSEFNSFKQFLNDK